MPASAPPSPFSRPPDRRPAYVRRNFYLLCVCLALLLVVVAGLAYALLARGSGTAEPGAAALPGEFRRELAGKLLSSGLRLQAIEQYEAYLRETSLPADRRAAIAFTLGKLSMEERRYEQALSWLYQVEMLDPGSDLASEAGAKIVTCLERLGRYAQAQYSLEARSGLDGDRGEEFRGERVVARIGKDTITLRELDEAIDGLPEWMRGTLDDPARKQEFLRQYVAEELLFRKARRLGLDEDPVVRRQADRALRQFMVQKVLEGEIREKVHVTPDDVELYFKANEGRYREKEAFKVRLIRVSQDRLDDLLAALARGEDFAALARRYSEDEKTRDRGGEIEEWIEEGLDPTGMGDPARLWEALSHTAEGEVTAPLESGDDRLLLRVDKHRQARPVKLEDVRQQVERDLYRERAEKVQQDLIRQAIENSDVEIYPEALRGDAPEGKG